MAALFDGTSARGDDKWAPAMDGLPEDITMDMNSSFVDLAHYEDTPSPDLITPRSTMREDSITSEARPDVLMANIRRKRPRPSKSQSMASNSVIDTCIMDLAASMKATIPVATTPVETETDTIAECINLLHFMPQITDDSPLYATALNSFMVKDKRILWMRLRSDEGRMTWLKSQMS